jgi:putative sterol carrier protein
MSEVAEIFESFFEKVVPVIFDSVTGAFPVQGMEGTEFTLQVNLTGEGATRYGLTIKDAREISVSKGELQSPMLTVELPTSIFIDMIKNMTSQPMREAYNAAGDTSGAIILEPLTKEGKVPFSVKFIFNRASEPNICLRSDMQTLMALMNGEDSPITAFMQGKLKIDGNLTFGMELMNKFAAFIPSPS